MLIAWFAAVNGWRLLTVVLGAAIVHEVGHWLALRVLGARILGLRIGLFGAVMEVESHRLSYGGELVSVLAGPGANLLCAFALTALKGMEPAIGAHLMLGAFNLLPVWPLDGGRALWLLAAWAFGPAVGERAVRWTGRVTALLLGVGVCYLIQRTGGSLWLLPAAGGLLMAAFQEWKGNVVDFQSI